MKAGSFNIHDYIGKLYEHIGEEDLDKILNEEEGGKMPDSNGLIIPEENKRAYDWLKKEFQKGQTEVKVEMSSHEFKPGYHLDTNQKSVKDFEPGMYGQVKTSENNIKRETAVPFPQTKFPGSETKSQDDNKKDKSETPKGDDKNDKKEDKKIPKVEVRTAKKD